MTRGAGGRAARLALLTIVGLVVSAASASAASASPLARRACSASPAAGHASCFVLVRTDLRSRTEAQVAGRAGVRLRHGRPESAAAPSGYGYGPSQLQSAYKLASAAAADGGDATVAVVDAYNDPNAAADLAEYRAAYGLPSCGTGCFEQLNQNGQTSPLPANSGSTGWATEESLDVDMVSAICPHCKIMLVEANSSSFADLGAAVDAAIAAGAQYVSNSYGGKEFSGETGLDTSSYDHPGDVITASAGDNGYGVSYPAASPDVVAVGGTTLTKASNTRGWSESVWGSAGGGGGTGSGCSAYEPKPSWQTDPDCADRIVGDVSADANPSTGVAVYDTYDRSGWLQVGGTSASSPIIASVYALAGPPTTSLAARTLYDRPQDLFDVTRGANGSCGTSLCTAEVGYDGPTGLGTPDGIGAFTTASAGPANTVAPTIAGTPQDGKTLTAKHGTWSPSTGVTYAYQWEKCSSGALDSCTPITGATGSTLAMKAGKVGLWIAVEVTATDADGSTTVTSAQVGPVQDPAPPVLKKAPVISGTLAPGSKLTGSTGTWASPDKLTYAYEWELCPGQSSSGCTAAGSTTRTLTLTSADSGRYVMFQVTATDQEGQSSSTSVFSSGPVS